MRKGKGGMMTKRKHMGAGRGEHDLPVGKMVRTENRHEEQKPRRTSAGLMASFRSQKPQGLA